MTTFTFRASRADGEIVAGQIVADSQSAAVSGFADRGLFLLRIEEARRPTARGRVSADLAAALSGMAALLEAGLPADRAVAAAAETSPRSLAEPLAEACRRVREGAPVSTALEESGVITPLVAALIRAGESSGALATGMAAAAATLERELEARAKLRAALTYPAFVAIAGSASIIVIAGFVVPRFADLIGDQQRQLPAATRALLGFSSFVAAFGPALVLVTLVALAVLAAWMRTAPGQLKTHRALLELPLVGPLRHRFATARICAALGSLLDAGVPMLTAIDRSLDTAGDTALRERLVRARADVVEGARLATALRTHAALSDGALRLTAFGESAGRLGRFLAHAAAIEGAAAHRAVQRLVSLAEPILILLFGAAVAFVATALFQAMYSVRPGL